MPRTKYIVSTSENLKFGISVNRDEGTIIVGGPVQGMAVMVECIESLFTQPIPEPVLVAKNKITFKLSVDSIDKLKEVEYTLRHHMAGYTVYSGLKTFGRLMR